MSAAETLRMAETAGVELAARGSRLRLRANRPPPQDLVASLREHKAEIIALLATRETAAWRPSSGQFRPRSARNSPSAAEWRALFDERAHIAESSCGLPRGEAEARAFAHCVVEWLDRHIVPSQPGRCAWCGKAESPSAVVLPFGTIPDTHVWLHPECWSPWRQARRAEAVAALGAMGVRAEGCAT